MKKITILFALLCVAIISSNRAMAVELDTVWVSDINGQVLFQHPVSKSIIIANNGITELFSNDGKFVRSFPFDVTNSDLSPDGTKILNSEMNTKIYNFSEELPFYTIENSMYGKFLGNNNIVYKTLKSNGNKIAKINLITKETIIVPANGGITAVATSSDGKYISYAIKGDNNGENPNLVKLYLLDAVTMKQLKELGSWDGEGKYIRSVHFSPDSKYLTFDPEYYSGNFTLNIYDVEKRNLLKTINKINFNFEYGGITLLGNNLYILNGANEFSLPKFKFELHNLEENKMLFSLDEFALGGGIFNKELNHLYGTSKITMCLNIKDIISGVQSMNPINVRYSQKKLIINNNDKPINNISIMTIEGREVFKQNFERLLNVNNPIEIPLELSNGSYIINLVSDKETYTEKIMVVE